MLLKRALVLINSEPGESGSSAEGGGEAVLIGGSAALDVRSLNWARADETSSAEPLRARAHEGASTTEGQGTKANVPISTAPATVDAKEQYFMEQVGLGEQLAARGSTIPVPPLPPFPPADDCAQAPTSSSRPPSPSTRLSRSTPLPRSSS